MRSGELPSIYSIVDHIEKQGGYPVLSPATTAEELFRFELCNTLLSKFSLQDAIHWKNIVEQVMDSEQYRSPIMPFDELVAPWKDYTRAYQQLHN